MPLPLFQGRFPDPATAAIVYPELLADPGFDDAAKWPAPTNGYSVAGGFMNMQDCPSGTVFGIPFTGPIISGASYRLVWDILNRTAGGVSFVFTGPAGNYAAGKVAPGTVDFVAVGAHTGFRLQTGAITTLQIASMSLKRIA